MPPPIRKEIGMIDWGLLYLTATCMMPLIIRIQPGSEDSRNMVFAIMIGGFILANTVVGNDVVVMSRSTVPAMVLAVWIMASMLWTETNKSAMEVITWISYLTVFMSVQGRDPVPAVVVISTIGTACSSYQLYLHYKKKFTPLCTYGGNTNHNSAFLITSMISSVWGIAHVGPVFILPAMITGVAVALGGCRGGMVSLVAVLIFLLASVVGEWAIVATIASVVLGMIYLSKSDPEGELRRSAYNRVMLFWAAVRMIHKKAVFGYGMDMFRKLLPEEQRKMSEEPTGLSSHRVHNDHLELMVEVGLVGYALLVYLLFQSGYSLEYYALIVSIAITGMFFFPLREVHTAAPFWILAGLLGSWEVTGVASTSAMGKVVIFLLVLAVMKVAVRKFIALCLFDSGVRAQDSAEKVRMLDLAIAMDPHNTRFLSSALVPNHKDDPEKTLRYAMDAWSTFNGDMMKWGILDQLSRSLHGVKKSSMVRWAVSEALSYNKVYFKSLQMDLIIRKEGKGGDKE